MPLLGFPLEDIPRKVASHSFLPLIRMVGDCYVKGFWQCPLHLINVHYTIGTLGYTYIYIYMFIYFFYHLKVWILFHIKISKLAVVDQIEIFRNIVHRVVCTLILETKISQYANWTTDQGMVMSFTQPSFISSLLTYLASTTCLKTTKFSLKSEKKKANLHAHKK